MSLGCSNGELDVGLIKNVLQHKKSLHFTDIDFSAEDIDRFRENISTMDEEVCSNIILKYGKFDETTELGECCDLITMVYFLYPFSDVIPVIKNALRHLSPKGKLLIIQTSDKGVASIKSEFTDILPDYKFQCGEQIKDLLVA